jgi:integrase
VRFDERGLHVVGKGKKLRRVPLHPVLLEVLQRRKATNPTTATVLGKGGSSRDINLRLTRLLKRVGVDGGNRPTHAFRKTVASVLIEEGARPNDVDQILGCAAPDVRNRYYVRRNPNLGETIKLLYASDPIDVAPAVPLRLVEAV